MIKFEIKDTEKLESFEELEKKYLHPNDNFEEWWKRYIKDQGEVNSNYLVFAQTSARAAWAHASRIGYKSGYNEGIKKE
jgi:hypothetical protein